MASIDTLDLWDEDFLARLTRAAYEVALRHRVQSSFLDVELDLWAALRPLVEEHALANEVTELQAAS